MKKVIIPLLSVFSMFLVSCDEHEAINIDVHAGGTPLCDHAADSGSRHRTLKTNDYHERPIVEYEPLKIHKKKE